MPTLPQQELKRLADQRRAIEGRVGARVVVIPEHISEKKGSFDSAQEDNERS
jgi:hypothetical protein